MTEKASSVKARNAASHKDDKTKKDNSNANTKEETDLDEVWNRLSEAREKIGLKTAPLTTTRLFLLYVLEFTFSTVRKVLKSYITWLLVVPTAVGWVATRSVLAPELFLPPVCGEKEPGMLWWVELAVMEAFWWLLLGVLSSIGFGTGLHSGLMFLFPHVMQVVGAAEGCGTTAGLISWYQHPCKFDCSTTYGPKDGSTVTFLRLWTLVTVQCMLWGIGTAAGELPPYLVSKAARLSGSKDDDFQKELDEARGSKDVFSRMKIWTIDFTEKHGFIGVLMLASWPNAAFDMCGMCCGYLLMPFWTFFVACCLGKGIIKVNGQAMFFVNLFGSAAFQIMLSGLDTVNGALTGIVGKDLGLRALAEKGRTSLILKFEQQSRFPAQKLFSNGESRLDLDAVKRVFSKWDDSDVLAKRVIQAWDTNKDGALVLSELEGAASVTDGKISLSSLDPGTGTSVLKTLWELFIVGLILFFVFSVVNQLAQSKQHDLDKAEIKRLEEEKAKKKKQ